VGQECAQKPTEPQPPLAQSAPTPGHPLDPNDVAILTGHARSSAPAAYGTPYAAPTVVYGYTQPYSFGMGQRFGFQGFFFPRSGRLRAPLFGGPFAPFFFSGFTGGRH
jgi:hypothetical protein